MNRRDFIHDLLGVAAISAGVGASRSSLAQSAPVAQPSPPTRPQLVGVDENGRAVRLADYAGRACLVSFFTSGCNLCLNDLKLMREFNRDNRAKRFVMLAVSLDEKRNDYLDYAKLIALSVPVAQQFPLLWRGAPEHSDSFGAITQWPTHFVLDRSHQLLRTRQGSFKPEDWDDLWTLLE